ncbi:MAG: hypothetical protein WCC27_20685 [Acidobacteriaceae bacterium]
MFWIVAIVTTLVFFFFLSMMMMVPGVEPRTNLWMLAIVAVCASVSLAVGVWRPSTSDAPMAGSRAAAVMGVALALEFLYCILGFVQFVSRTRR